MAAVGLLLVGAAVAVTARSDGQREVPSDESTQVDVSNVTISSAEALKVVRVSSAAVGNMDLMTGALIQACMAQLGFVFTPNSTAAAIVEDEGSFLQRRYQSPHMEKGSWGYIFEDAGAESNEPMEILSPDADKPGFTDALLGETVVMSTVDYPDGSIATANSVGDGCHGQAVSAMFGSPAAYLQFFDRLNRIEAVSGHSWSRLRTNPEYLRRRAAWVDCMSVEGYDFLNPESVWDFAWPSPRPSPSETLTAETDAVCRASNQLDNQDLLALELSELDLTLRSSPIAPDELFDKSLQALIDGVRPVDA